MAVQTVSRLICALPLWLSLCLALVADGQTITAQSALAPPARAHHSMVYDAAARRVLVVGGSTSNDGGKTYSTFDDIWSFDGKSWTGGGASGAERSGMAIAFDTKRNRLLAFGGYCPCRKEDGGRYPDLVELTNGRWVTIASIPTRPTTDAKMVYDARRDRMVLFGGVAAGNKRLNDTWEFDGTSWRSFAGVSPEPRGDFAMAYDSQRARTVLVGGFGDPASETWEFDGATWSRVNTTGPAARTLAMVYDTRRHQMVFFNDASETWSWNGQAWTALAKHGPPTRYMAAMAYDTSRDRVVMFGGRPGLPAPDANDTWEWDGATWKEAGASRATHPATPTRVAAVTGTGFISLMAPDGTVLNRKWIAGGENGITLNGPKGLALRGDDLWVANITVVRRFNTRTRQQTGIVDLAPLGASFLNDVAAGPDGSLNSRVPR